MFGLGVTELIIILVIILIMFGAGKLPEIGEGLGRGIKNFRRATRQSDEIDVTPASESEQGDDDNGDVSGGGQAGGGPTQPGS
ncbi:MAG TPA: twin-arginine translocase TatA/TatE family subunit [Deltaproteobacteria bacterium]|nr:twin-arginine translocase TatA/TatE family subunit [Candidatus Binatota bacterium]HIL12614.1 twin-arginine translocase TatA/TatE family subunit [Deltaproteobacteria bacterium]